MSSQFSNWLQAARVRTLFLSIAVLTSGAAYTISIDQFKWPIYILSLLTALFLQILSNFANDYGDYAKGTDNDQRLGPSRALQSGAITKKSMKRAILITSVLSFILGILLISVSFSKQELPYVFMFAFLGIASIWAAIKYTAGKNAYGYLGFGDLFVFLFFGLIGVGGSAFLHTKVVSLDLMLLSVSFGCFSVGVLNVNNMRDIDNDKNNHKLTIPVKIGLAKAKLYHLGLLLLAWLCIIYFSFRTNAFQLTFITAPIFMSHMATVFKNEGKALDPELKRLSLASLFTSILLLIEALR